MTCFFINPNIVGLHNLNSIKSRKDAEDAFGPNHPNVATTLGLLALYNQNQGKYSEAEPLYKRSL